MDTSRDDGPDDDAVWRALSHRTRRRILDVVFGAPSTTGRIVTELGLDRHVVMAHLAVLREADLVTSHREGRLMMNFANSVPIRQIHQRWVEPTTAAPWAAALIAVRDSAEAATAAADDERGEDVV